MASSRPSLPTRRARAVPRAGTPFVGVVSGVGLVVSVFLPWYATNLGPPFSATSASGWESTTVARIALAAGLLVTLASAVLVLEERGGLRLARRHGDALARLVVAAGVVAALLVGFRMIVMPDPAEFLSREIGLYLAFGASIGAILSGLAQVATRD
jgi:hypothetical protein